MRLPRLTTRRLMVLVAVAALMLFVGRWIGRLRAAAECARSARYWRWQASVSAHFAPGSGLSEAEYRKRCLEKSRGYEELSARYWRAARRPWLPIPPDSPPPE